MNRLIKSLNRFCQKTGTKIHKSLVIFAQHW